jgi:prepilin-type processing-associated H-X9-DG protein
MFGNENKGQFFPELSPKSGRLAMLNKSAGSEGPIIPEYLSDPTLFFCPLAPEHNVRPGNDTDETPDPQTDFLDKSSYMYLGFAVTNETELQAFADAYRDRIAKGLRLNVDLPVAPGSGTLGRDKLLRLRDELEKQFVADPGDRTACAKIAASIPVLVERLGHHKPEGGNVLYLDGHVEFIRYPGKFPMTETGMEILTSLESQFSTE